MAEQALSPFQTGFTVNCPTKVTGQTPFKVNWVAPFHSGTERNPEIRTALG